MKRDCIKLKVYLKRCIFIICSFIRMWHILLFFTVCVYIQFVASLQGFLLGPGRWLVLNIHTCANPEQYDIMLEITSRKINRTHDCFDLSLELHNEFNVTYAVEIELYQEGDGGFKYHQTMKQDSICTWILTNARENAVRALTLAGVDPPKCPIPAGFHHAENFVMDYTELPRIGIYGTWEARVFLTYHKKRVGCVRLILNFEIRNDDESNEDDVVGSILSPVKSMMPGFS